MHCVPDRAQARAGNREKSRRPGGMINPSEQLMLKVDGKNLALNCEGE